MKFNQILFMGASVGLLSLSACDKIPGTSPKLGSEKDSLSYALGVNIGNSFKEAGLDTLVNKAVLQQTVDAALKGDSLQMTNEQATAFLQKYFQSLQMKKVEGNLKAGQQFLNENKNKAGVKTTGSGLQYIVLKEGNGPSPKATDTVTVHYLGTLTNGKKFDSSYDSGSPATFPVNGVIPGWTEALQLMKVGSKYKLFVPSELAYGPQGNRGIEPNSVLVFEVELLGINQKPAEQPGLPQMPR